MRTRSSTAKRLLKLITGISLMTLCAAPTAFAAVTTSTDPLMSKPFLNYSSQVRQAWTNTVPNALASYYTYQPLSAADAVTVGFPNATNVSNPTQNPRGHICGIAGTGDGSNADCYIISVRQFRQPMSLDFLKFAGITGLFSGNGLLGTDGTTPLVDTSSAANFLLTNNGTDGTRTGTPFGTLAWGYGSGGANWQPYYPTLVGAATPGQNLPYERAGISGNAPGPFQTVTFNAFFGPGQNGDPAAKGVWHFPAPTIKGTGKVPGAPSGQRPVYVQWLNELPNSIPPGHDPTVDCGTQAPNCYPYNRQVVHVHGAHVGPESDGLATSWYTPNYAVKGEGAALFTGMYATTPLNPTPINYYPMDQEASTIWYHDHAIGTTHLNTNQGMAGFFPVTDAQEQALITAKTLPTGAYELGFALQDRHFDTTGQMIMPDHAIYDKTNPSCTYLDAPGNSLPDPSNPNCVRTPFLKMADTSVQGWHFVPLAGNQALLGNALNPTTGCVNNANQPFPVAGECAPFGASSATLEYFGVMPVVNGVTYGNYPIATPGVYRMRFIGGTDSRTWLLQLQYDNAGTPTVLPFYQIASEQGLLNAPAERTMIDLMGGERIDVLVDFNSLPKDGQGNILPVKVFLKDLNEDAPYAGGMITDPAFVAPNLSSIPDIMVFDVAGGAPVQNSTAPLSITNLRPTAPLPTIVLPAEYERNIALVEITDTYGRTMPTIDARGYRPAEVPISENILKDQIEQWNIINTTVDAHPMHLHQVAFQLINRQAVDSFTPPQINNLGDKGYSPAFPPIVPDDYVNVLAAETIMTSSQYVPVGAVIPPQPYETLSLKDTVDCPPGYVTRIITKFDILGTYVWHCHILSHEEHDMMRPFRVVANKIATPAWISPSATADANGNAYVIVGATTTASIGSPLKYVVQFRKIAPVADAFWTTSPTNVRNPYIDLKPTGPGTYQFRAQVVDQVLEDHFTTNLADSNWIVSTRNTVYSDVSAAPSWFSVPATTQSGGKVYVIAAPSSTPGALYNFQYRTAGTTPGPWVDAVMASAARNVTISLPTAAPGNYDIQVFVTAPAPFTQSAARQGTTTYSAVAAPSPWFGVPATTTTGSVYVIAGASATPGATYTFQVSTNGPAGPWSPIGVADGPRNQTLFLGASSGGTTAYTLQVFVNAPGFSISPAKLGDHVVNW